MLWLRRRRRLNERSKVEKRKRHRTSGEQAAFWKTAEQPATPLQTTQRVRSLESAEATATTQHTTHRATVRRERRLAPTALLSSPPLALSPAASHFTAASLSAPTSPVANSAVLPASHSTRACVKTQLSSRNEAIAALYKSPETQKPHTLCRVDSASLRDCSSALSSATSRATPLL